MIVVTHLPQVAAYADRHLVVDKSARDGGGVTRSRVRTLAEDERIVELARMLAGLDDTDTGRAHAEELLGTRPAAHREADRAAARRRCRNGAGPKSAGSGSAGATDRRRAATRA